MALPSGLVRNGNSSAKEADASSLTILYLAARASRVFFRATREKPAEIFMSSKMASTSSSGLLLMSDSKSNAEALSKSRRSFDVNVSPSLCRSIAISRSVLLLSCSLICSMASRSFFCTARMMGSMASKYASPSASRLRVLTLPLLVLYFDFDLMTNFNMSLMTPFFIVSRVFSTSLITFSACFRMVSSLVFTTAAISLFT